MKVITSKLWDLYGGEVSLKFKLSFRFDSRDQDRFDYKINAYKFQLFYDLFSIEKQLLLGQTA